MHMPRSLTCMPATKCYASTLTNMIADQELAMGKEKRGRHPEPPCAGVLVSWARLCLTSPQ